VRRKQASGIRHWKASHRKPWSDGVSRLGLSQSRARGARQGAATVSETEGDVKCEQGVHPLESSRYRHELPARSNLGGVHGEISGRPRGPRRAVLDPPALPTLLLEVELLPQLVRHRRYGLSDLIVVTLALYVAVARKEIKDIVVREPERIPIVE
jgi:hypothetical protein